MPIIPDSVDHNIVIAIKIPVFAFSFVFNIVDTPNPKVKLANDPIAISNITCIMSLP